MATFDDIRKEHSDYSPAYPEDWQKPSEEELIYIQSNFGIKYSSDFIQFQLVECHTTPMGDFAFDGFGWANPELELYLNLREIVKDAQEIGVPKSLAPFKWDNGDYYCITLDGAVVIWDHNSSDIEKNPDYRWASFSDWLFDSFEDDE